MIASEKWVTYMWVLLAVYAALRPAKDSASTITGSSFVLDGGWTAQ
ncbi:hypothetical protein HNV08_05360 [Winogradskyella eckloniae]|nr:hypothetical protein [Winogradskyella eckloniae]NRD19467.1 hypothetical protein [Winogradskyella eckloniae]